MQLCPGKWSVGIWTRSFFAFSSLASESKNDPIFFF
jgi:hypothetical protein